MNSIKWYIFNRLKELPCKVHLTYGAATKLARADLKLEKSHINDAYAMGKFHPNSEPKNTFTKNGDEITAVWKSSMTQRLLISVQANRSTVRSLGVSAPTAGSLAPPKRHYVNSGDKNLNRENAPSESKDIPFSREMYCFTTTKRLFPRAHTVVGRACCFRTTKVSRLTN